MKRLSKLRFTGRTYVMGVLNVTPDSFSDGGSFFNKDRAVRRALSMARDGADIIDVGGESTRPGAREIDAVQEIERVIPVIRAISKKIDIPISIDTRKAEVADTAIRSGARIVNDVSGLRHDENMASVISESGAMAILMHMKGTPEDMQDSPRYKDVVKDIIRDLKFSVRIAKSAGIKDSNIIIDPGIGFGKTLRHNLAILDSLEDFKVLKLSICIGVSRKSFIGKILGLKDPSSRLTGTIASSVMAIVRGANIIRVHDVKEAVQAARITDAIMRAGDS